MRYNINCCKCGEFLGILRYEEHNLMCANCNREIVQAQYDAEQRSPEVHNEIPPGEGRQSQADTENQDTGGGKPAVKGQK